MSRSGIEAAAPRPHCCNCAHFDASPLALERAFPGMAAMGSGFSAVRGGDGLCGRHGRYLSGSSSCPGFQARKKRERQSPL